MTQVTHIAGQGAMSFLFGIIPTLKDTLETKEGAIALEFDIKGKVVGFASMLREGGVVKDARVSYIPWDEQTRPSFLAARALFVGLIKAVADGTEEESVTIIKAEVTPV